MLRVALSVLFLASCTASLELPGGLRVTCSGDAECPSGQRCLLDAGVCAAPNQACVSEGSRGLSAVADGSVCTKSDGSEGVCVTGLCRAPPCGDGVRDSGEACDDGNTQSGDGCTADCSKVETCGDGITDANELCDDGANANPNDGCDACATTHWAASVTLGRGLSRGGLDNVPFGGGTIALGRKGQIYVFDDAGCRLLRIDLASSASTVVAGSGVCDLSMSPPNGDGVVARVFDLAAYFNAMAVDADDVVYLFSGAYLYRIEPDTGRLTWIAGTGDRCSGSSTCPSTGDPREIPLGFIGSLSFSADNTLYFADGSSSTVRAINPDRTTERVVAGIPFAPGDNFVEGMSPSAMKLAPNAMVAEPNGRLYVSANGRLVRIDFDADTVHKVADVSSVGLARNRSGVVVLFGGTRIYQLSTSEVLTPIAGTGVAGASGDGGPALGATILTYSGIVFDSGQVVFENQSDSDNHTLRSIDSGVVSTVVRARPYNQRVLGRTATSTYAVGINDYGVAPNGDIYLDYQAYLLRVDATTGLLEYYGGHGSSRDEGVNVVDAAVGGGGSGFVFDTDGSAILAVPSAILRVDKTTKQVTTVAGKWGQTGYSAADNVPALDMRFNGIGRLFREASGDLLFADQGSARLRRLHGGIVTTVSAGQSTAVTAAPTGEIFIINNANVYLVHADGTRELFVSGTNDVSCESAAPYCGDGGPANAAKVVSLNSIATDQAGGLLVLGNRLRRVNGLTPTSTISTIGFTGTKAFAGDGADVFGAGGDEARVSTVGGAIYTFSQAYVRRIGPDGIVSTVAGAVDAFGDGPAETSELSTPGALVAIADGQWLIADGASGRIRLFDESAAKLSTVTGHFNGLDASVAAQSAHYIAPLGEPAAIVRDSGRIIVAEPTTGVIRSVSTNGASADWTTTPLNQAASGYRDGAIATARFAAPSGIALDNQNGILWIADTGNHLIRALDIPTGIVSTVAGEPLVHGFDGDGSSITNARFNAPSALAWSNGALYIADTGNNRVRRIVDGTTIETVLGDGSSGSSGDGEHAHDIAAERPRGLVFDSYGNLWVTTTTSVRVISAGADGIVTGEDPVHTVYGAAPRSTFPESVTTCLTGLAMRPGDASAYVLDSCLGLMVRLDRGADTEPSEPLR